MSVEYTCETGITRPGTPAGVPEQRATLQIGPKTRIEDGDGAHAALEALERLAEGDIVAVKGKKDRAGTIAARRITLLDEPANGTVS